MAIKNRIISSELVSWKDFEFIQSKDFKNLSNEAHDKLKKSIIENDFVESFKCWRHEDKIFCLDGYHRIKVLKELKAEGHDIPEMFRADFIDCKDKQEASKLVLIYSSFYAHITEEGFLKYLQENDLDFEDVREMIDIPDFNLEKFEIENLTSEVKEDDFNAQEEYEKIVEPISKRGDVYELGVHRLINADCSVFEEIEVLLSGDKAHLVFTDPPYNVNYKSPGNLSYDSKKYGGTGGKIFNDDKTDDDCLQFYTNVLKNLHHFTYDYSCIYWWFANKNQHINRQAFLNSNWYFSQTIVWIKNGFVFSRGQDYHRAYEPCMFGWKKGNKHFKNRAVNNLQDVFSLDYNDFQEIFDVWYVKRDPTQTYVHPTQKPVRLSERALKKSSRTGDIVLDFFGGSGSTLLGCEQMGRKAYLAELDPKYCDVIVKRYIKFCKDNNKVLLVKKNNQEINYNEYGF